MPYLKSPHPSDLGPGSNRVTWLNYIARNRATLDGDGNPDHRAIVARILELSHRLLDEFTIDELARELTRQGGPDRIVDSPAFRRDLRLALTTLVLSGVLRQIAGRGVRNPDRWRVIYRPN